MFSLLNPLYWSEEKHRPRQSIKPSYCWSPQIQLTLIQFYLLISLDSNSFYPNSKVLLFSSIFTSPLLNDSSLIWYMTSIHNTAPKFFSETHLLLFSSPAWIPSVLPTTFKVKSKFLSIVWLRHLMFWPQRFPLTATPTSPMSKSTSCEDLGRLHSPFFHAPSFPILPVSPGYSLLISYTSVLMSLLPGLSFSSPSAHLALTYSYFMFHLYH